MDDSFKIPLIKWLKSQWLREKSNAKNLYRNMLQKENHSYLNGELNAQTLASQSAILGPSLSRILNRLEDDGVLVRKVSPGDQRELIISLGHYMIKALS